MFLPSCRVSLKVYCFPSLLTEQLCNSAFRYVRLNNKNLVVRYSIFSSMKYKGNKAMNNELLQIKHYFFTPSTILNNLPSDITFPVKYFYNFISSLSLIIVFLYTTQCPPLRVYFLGALTHLQEHLELNRDFLFHLILYFVLSLRNCSLFL